MEFPVLWRGEKIGEVTVTEMPQAVTFSVDCACVSEELLRCYAKTEPEPLLIGVMEPVHHRLVCQKKISRQSLHRYGAEIPQQYYLSRDGRAGENHAETVSTRTAPPSNGHQTQLWTGSPLFDQIIAAGTVAAQETSAGLQLSCPFAPGAQLPLACVATACCITRNEDGYVAAFVSKNLFFRV